MEKDTISVRKPVSSIWLGLFLIAAGTIIAAWRLHYNVPAWLVSWPMALLASGLLLGIYSRFKTIFWIIPVFWGVYLMALLYAPGLNLAKYGTAASFILAGVVLLGIRSARPSFAKTKARFGPAQDDSFITANSFLCNLKREVTSRHFKGADAVSILGNTVIDLRNADIQGTARIDVTALLGNTKIYIPEAWAMRNGITAFLGNIRHTGANINPVVADDKVIVFDGTAILGNIAIISC